MRRLLVVTVASLLGGCLTAFGFGGAVSAEAAKPVAWQSEGALGWAGAHWIGGRQPQDHNWTDMTETVDFRVTNPAVGVTFLFHAQPVGKTWGEFYGWKLDDAGPGVELVESTSHYAGNTGVPGGTPAVQWGVNYYDPQSQTNPTATGTRSVPIATVSGPTLGGIDPVTLATADHQIRIAVAGNTVTTFLDGTQVDKRTLSLDQLRASGSVGFGAGSAAVIRDVTVTAPGQPTFHTDFAGGSNPFEAGAPTPGGAGSSGGLNVSTAGAHPATSDATSGVPAGSALPPLPTGVLGKDVVLPIANPAPLLRDAFRTEQKQVTSARLSLAAGGYVSMTVNGAPVTTDGGPARIGNVPHLLPDQSSYDKTVFYDSFDVTRLVRSGGENVLAAELGRGWYGLATPDEWYWQMPDYHGAPRLLTKLVLTYADGSTQTIVSDPAAWRTTDGPTTYDSVYTGEKYDARTAQALGNWRSPGYDARDWQPATVMNPPGSCTGPVPAACHDFLPDTTSLPSGFVPATLRPQVDPPALVNRVLHPTAIYETYPGSHVYIFDFGQIMTGWPHLHLSGIQTAKAGRTLRLRADESLWGTGTAAAPYWITENDGYYDADAQTDYYTLSGAGTQDWEPSFSYAGYRYVEVRGLYDVLGRAPSLATDGDLLTAQVARSGFATTGDFGSSNALLNRIWQNVRWAEQNNSVAKETDTPTREKNGWTGDAQAGSESEMLDFDMRRFFDQWLGQFPDAQISTGEIPKIVPAAKGGYGYDQTPGWNFVWGPLPAWDAAFFVIPWELYRYYDDTQILRNLYPSQKRLMDYYASRFTAANNYTYNTSLGEYGAFQGELVDPVTPVINQQYYFYFADYMAKVAALLGDGADASKYRALATSVLASFQAKYWSSQSGAFTGADADPGNPQALAGLNVESVNAMAIAFGMVPGPTPADRAANEASAAAAIAKDLRAHHDHIQTGVYGLHYLFGVLDRFGYTNLAYAAATQTTPGSYGDQIAQGATSLWEIWETGPYFSRDHHYYSSIGTWFYQGLAGIRPASPGYGTVLIIPHVPSNKGTSSVPASVADEGHGTKSTLDRVSASIVTVRGRVSSAWRRAGDGRVVLRVCLPVNTPGEVWVPTENQPVEAPPQAKFVSNDSQGQTPYDVFHVAAGCNTFNRSSQ